MAFPYVSKEHHKIHWDANFALRRPQHSSGWAGHTQVDCNLKTSDFILRKPDKACPDESLAVGCWIKEAQRKTSPEGRRRKTLERIHEQWSGEIKSRPDVSPRFNHPESFLWSWNWANLHDIEPSGCRHGLDQRHKRGHWLKRKEHWMKQRVDI